MAEAKAFDPTDCCVIILTWDAIPQRCGMVQFNTIPYLEDRGIPRANIHSVCLRWIPVARNWAIKNVGLTSGKRHIVMIDNDMPIDGKANPFWEATDDVVVCMAGTAERWSFANAFHSGMFRADRRVFEDIEPPWFDLPASADGTVQTDCTCGYFRDKAVAASFSITHAGWCAHP